MPEQLLHAAQIQAGFDQMRGIGMAQAVDRHLFADAAVGDDAGKRLLRAAAVHDAGGRRSAHARKQQLGVAMIAPVAPQARQRQRRQHDETVLAALAVADMHLLALAVDVADAQMQRFAQAQAQAVGRPPERLIAPLARAPDDPRDLIHREHIRQRLHLRRLEHVHPRPFPAQHVLEEELQAAALDLDQAPGAAIDQRREVDLEVLSVQPVRTAVEVRADPPHRPRVAVNRRLGLALQLERPKMLGI